MINYAKAIQSIRPDSQFVIIGEDLENIEWHVITGEIPTKAEILAAMETVEKAEKDAEKSKANAKAALLERLGITADEAALLLG